MSIMLKRTGTPRRVAMSAAIASAMAAEILFPAKLLAAENVAVPQQVGIPPTYMIKVPVAVFNIHSSVDRAFVDCHILFRDEAGNNIGFFIDAKGEANIPLGGMTGYVYVPVPVALSKAQIAQYGKIEPRRVQCRLNLRKTPSVWSGQQPCDSNTVGTLYCAAEQGAEYSVDVTTEY